MVSEEKLTSEGNSEVDREIKIKGMRNSVHSVPDTQN